MKDKTWLYVLGGLGAYLLLKPKTAAAASAAPVYGSPLSVPNSGAKSAAGGAGGNVTLATNAANGLSGLLSSILGIFGKGGALGGGGGGGGLGAGGPGRTPSFNGVSPSGTTGAGVGNPILEPDSTFGFEGYSGEGPLGLDPGISSSVNNPGADTGGEINSGDYTGGGDFSGFDQSYLDSIDTSSSYDDNSLD